MGRRLTLAVGVSTDRRSGVPARSKPPCRRICHRTIHLATSSTGPITPGKEEIPRISPTSGLRPEAPGLRHGARPGALARAHAITPGRRASRASPRPAQPPAGRSVAESFFRAYFDVSGMRGAETRRGTAGGARRRSRGWSPGAEARGGKLPCRRSPPPRRAPAVDDPLSSTWTRLGRSPDDRYARNRSGLSFTRDILVEPRHAGAGRPHVHSSRWPADGPLSEVRSRRKLMGESSGGDGPG